MRCTLSSFRCICAPDCSRHGLLRFGVQTRGLAERMAYKLKETIEIPLLLAYFAFMLNIPIDTHFIFYRTCTVELGFNETDCQKLGTPDKDNFTNELEKKVQPKANVIQLGENLANQILPALICFFVGSWTDKHGRKPILMLSAFGYTCTYIIKIVISLIPSASPWFLLLQSIPSTLTGGLTTFIMVSLCYVSDVTDNTNRGMRMGIFESVFPTSSVLGTFLSTYLYKGTGYTGVYAFCTVLAAGALIFCFFVIEESVENVEEVKNLYGILSLNRIKETLQTATKRRPNYNRSIIIILLASLVFYIVAINNGQIMFSYYRLKFHWDLEKFTTVMTINNVLWTIGSLSAIYVVHKKLGISELFLLLAGYLVMTTGTLLQTFGPNDYFVYSAIGVSCIGGVANPMTCSFLSKIIGPEDTGKIFSLMKAFESVAGILGNMLYTFLYNATIDSFLGSFNLFGTAVYLTNMAIVLVTMKLRTSENNPTYSLGHEE